MPFIKEKSEVLNIQGALSLINKPEHFMKMEVKNVGTNKYRINVVCKEYVDQSLIPIISRPKSYYVKLEGQKWVFNPEI